MRIACNPLIPLGEPLSIGSRSKQSDRFGLGTDKSSRCYFVENVHIHLLVHRTRSQCCFAVLAQCDHAAFKVRVWDCRNGRVAKLCGRLQARRKRNMSP
jgi:hypothetical protein